MDERAQGNLATVWSWKESLSGAGIVLHFFFNKYYPVYCSQHPCKMDDVVVPTLQMRKLRYRDINKLIWTVRAKN